MITSSFFFFSFALFANTEGSVAAMNLAILCRSPLVPHSLLCSGAAFVQRSILTADGFGSPEGCVLHTVPPRRKSTEGLVQAEATHVYEHTFIICFIPHVQEAKACSCL